MRAKRIGRDEQIRLIMECRGSGLSDYQWCEANGVLPGTFYMWISRLRKAGYTIPDPAKRQKAVPIIQDVVKLPVADSEMDDDMFVKQNANNPAMTSRTAVEIEFGSVTIRILNGADTKVVQSVLQFMGGVSNAW